MACGDRNTKGKPTDYVWHYSKDYNGKTLCGIHGNYENNIEFVTVRYARRGGG